MSSSTHAQPEHHGASPPGAAPQVVVRAGKTYVCTACGTLVEIPAEFVGQFVLATEQSTAHSTEPSTNQSAAQSASPPIEPPIEPPSKSSPVKPPVEEPATASSPADTASATKPPQPHASQPHASQATGTRQSFQLSEPSAISSTDQSRRPNRSHRRQRRMFAGQTIDGLTVPSARQLDQAFHWVEFRLGVLGRQDNEIRRLKKLLRQQHGTKVRPNPPRRVEKPRQLPPVQRDRVEQAKRAPVDLCAMPEGNRETERGPP